MPSFERILKAGARDSIVIDDITEPCQITWSVAVSNHDIGIEILYFPSNTTINETVSLPSRVVIQPSIKVVEDRCEFILCSPGRIEINLDNSGSMLRGKTVTINFSKGPVPSSFNPQLSLKESPENWLGTGALDITDITLMDHLAKKGVDLFFQNRFLDADGYFQSEKNRSAVFALSAATLMWLRGFMTLEAVNIEKATKALRLAQEVCKSTIESNTVPDYKNVNLMELNASLVHSEITLLVGLLQLMEESVISLVKAGLSMRSGWQGYMRINSVLGHPSEQLVDHSPFKGEIKIHKFEYHEGSKEEHVRGITDGLFFGVGGFNLIASILPPIAMRLLAAAGFPSDREHGMACFRRCLVGGGPRSVLCALAMLFMRVLVPSFHSGDISENIPEATLIVDKFLQIYPDSSLFLWMQGRLARLRRDIPSSIESLSRCQRLSMDLPQLVDLSIYELVWCRVFSHSWGPAVTLLRGLSISNNWSVAFYKYARAVCMLKMGYVREARSLFVSVLNVSNRTLGGKVIPAEQYALRRAAEFVALTKPFVGNFPEGSNSTLTDADMQFEYIPEDFPNEEPPSLLEELGYSGPRAEIPARLSPDSDELAKLLVRFIPAPHLELMYFFNGFNQSDDALLARDMADCDRLLRALVELNPHVEKSKKQPINAKSSLDEEMERACALDARGLYALLDAAVADGTSTAPGASSSEKQTEKSSSRFGFSGMLRGLGSAVSSTASAVMSAGGAVAGSVSGSMGISSKAKALPTVTEPLKPIHAACALALCRGAAAAGRGQADIAAAAFQWIINKTEAANKGKRELQFVSYAHYEMGILMLDITKALIRQVGARGGVGSGSNGGASFGIDFEKQQAILLTGLAAGKTIKSAKAEAKKYFHNAHAGRDDFNWRVRLHIRTHLAHDDLRRQKEHLKELQNANKNIQVKDYDSDADEYTEEGDAEDDSFNIPNVDEIEQEILKEEKENEN